MHFQPGELEMLEVQRTQLSEEERGCLPEVFRSDELYPEGMPVMGLVAETHPGGAQGPHEHHDQADRFCIKDFGKFEVRLWDNSPVSTTYRIRQTLTPGDGNPSIFIPPGAVHGHREPVNELRHETDQAVPSRGASGN